MLASVILYGGVGEIGGNKILVEDRGTRIFLDFGMSFKSKKNFYSPPYLSPKNEAALIEMGVLPKVQGLYRAEDSERGIDAVFISHAHLDHCGHISVLKRSISIYCGETAKTIIEALSRTRQQNFENDIDGLDLKGFRTGAKIRLDSIEVEPIHVDHSVPGSYGFLVHTSEGSIAYTGDYRMHGPRSDLTEDFVEKARDAEPKMLLTEGTNLTGATISSETDVLSKLKSLVANTRGLVMAEFSKTDMDRLKSFHSAAKSSSRKLAISPRQAYLLHSLADDAQLDVPKLDDDSILIYRKKRKRSYDWEETLIDKGEMVDAAGVSSMQGEIVLVTSLPELEELVEIRPVGGSSYVLSSSEPFDEEMELDFERLIGWLGHYGVPQYHIHVSGHIMPLQLRAAIEKISPRQIIPVHNEHPLLFKRFLQGLKSETILPEVGVSYHL